MLREPDLPRAAHDETSWALTLLVDRRDDLVSIRRGMISWLLDRVHALDPVHTNPANWDRLKVRADMQVWPATQEGLIAELARDEPADINRLTDQILALTDVSRQALCVLLRGAFRPGRWGLLAAD